MTKPESKKVFKSKEDVVSMFLGLVVVVAVVGFLVNFIEKRKGNVDVPGVSSDLVIEEKKDGTEEESSVESVTVEKNDSLWKIAVKIYGDGYKWTDIAKANNLKNPNILIIGQKLTLPKIEKNAADTEIKGKGDTVSENLEYVVVRGDNLWNIAVKFYGDGYKWTKIWQDNRSKLNSPSKLEIGMKLIIYGKI